MSQQRVSSRGRGRAVGRRRGRKIVFGASRSSKIWALLFLLANIALTLLVWRGFKNLG